MAVHMNGFIPKIVLSLTMVDISRKRFSELIDSGFLYSTGRGLRSVAEDKLKTFAIGKHKRAGNLGDWVSSFIQQVQGTPTRYEALRNFTQKLKRRLCPGFDEAAGVDPCKHLDLWSGIGRHPRSPFDQKAARVADDDGVVLSG